MREHWEFFKDGDTSMGVFYPMHYIVAAFDSEERARSIQSRFLESGFNADDVAVADGRYVVDKLESIEDAGLLDRAKQTLVRAVGTELGYLDDDRKVADRGGAFLFVYAPDTESLERATEVLKLAHPILARRYHAAGIHRISYPRQSVL